MSDHLLLYVIGAARSGTTWLSHALRAHPQIAVPPVKETHYFDSVESGNALWAMDQLIRSRQRARALLDDASSPAERRRRLRRLNDTDRWISLIGRQEADDARYESLMLNQLGDARRVAADVTPAYALLGAPTLARMSGLNGGRTRFVLLLRDPVDRLWSNIRMTLARRAERGADREMLRNEIMGRIADGHQTDEMVRSDYAGILARLDQAVPAAHRLVVFFEDLAETRTAQHLSDFLGLSDPLALPVDTVNSAAQDPLSLGETRLLRQLLAPQYHEVLSRFGTLPDRWTQNMMEKVQ